MKIAYIYLGAGAAESSVQHKIKAQIKALNDLGCKTTGIFFTEETNIPVNQEHIHWQGVHVAQKGWFQSLKERNAMTSTLYRWAAENAEEYDKIYVRNYRPTLWWYKFIKKNRDKVIVEHQTKEIDELLALWKANPFGWRPSLLLSWLEHNVIPWLQEKIYGSLANGAVKKIVAVTDEIAAYEKKRAMLGSPQTFVIGNGIQTDEFLLATPPPFDGTELNFLMLIGGTTETDWHGVDLILESIEKYPGNCKITLWLAGNLSNGWQGNKNVKILGFCSQKKRDDIFNHIHLAVGSFALQRKGLREASTLKVREYAARGVPFIFGHKDHDLESFVKNGCALELRAGLVPDMETILRFFEKMQTLPDVNTQIRNMCRENLDYSIKMKHLLTVFSA
ncbi:MAG: glycosyltransferase family 4 protein [Sphingomonadales bacterium]|nr:glycosyltransferase family 4 protein [Sphingomonadales bacterium]